MNKIISYTPPPQIQPGNNPKIAAAHTEGPSIKKRLLGGIFFGGGLATLIQTLIYPLTDIFITSVQTQGLTTPQAIKKYGPDMIKNPRLAYTGFSYVFLATFPRRVAIFVPGEVGSIIAKKYGYSEPKCRYLGILSGIILETAIWTPVDFFRTQAIKSKTLGKAPYIKPTDFWVNIRTSYTGFTPNLSKNFINNLLVYGVAKDCAPYFPFENKFNNLLASTLSFTIGVQVITTPLDTLRSVTQNNITTPTAAFREIIQTHGWKKFYGAVELRGGRQAIVSSFLMVTYEKMKEIFEF